MNIELYVNYGEKSERVLNTVIDALPRMRKLGHTIQVKCTDDSQSVVAGMPIPQIIVMGKKYVGTNAVINFISSITQSGKSNSRSARGGAVKSGRAGANRRMEENEVLTPELDDYLKTEMFRSGKKNSKKEVESDEDDSAFGATKSEMADMNKQMATETNRRKRTNMTTPIKQRAREQDNDESEEEQPMADGGRGGDGAEEDEDDRRMMDKMGNDD